MSINPFMKSQDNYKRFQVMIYAPYDEPYGGYEYKWTPAATFEGVLVLDDSIEAQRAEAEGVTGVYTLYYDKALRLPWHSVFREVDEPSRTYRVTSRDEKSTPSVSTLDLRQVKVEEWEIPG